MSSTVFISYSSLDQHLARKLASDLKELGHSPWLDEWEIGLGESIPGKIEHAIDKAQFVAIVLTRSSTSSSWVEREWRAKYWEEIKANQVMILPLLFEDCEIPLLLRNRRYADFRENYATALTVLNEALRSQSPAIPPTTSSVSMPNPLPVAEAVSDILFDLEENSADVLMGIPSGFKAIDHLTTGLQPGSLTTIAGSAGSGKTSFLLNVARTISCDRQLRVLFFSQGLAGKECVVRILCAVAGVPVLRFRQNSLRTVEWRRIHDASLRVKNSYLDIIDSLIIQPAVLRQALTANIEEDILNVVIIDDFHRLLFAEDTSAAETIQSFEQLARDHNIALICSTSLSFPDKILNQSSMGFEHLTPDEPQISLLNTSDLCLIISIAEPEASQSSKFTRSNVKVEVVRSRFGKVGSVELEFCHDMMIFFDIQAD